MSSITINRIKALAVGAAVTCALGGGAAVLLPSFASAAPVRHSLDQSLGYVSHTAHDAVTRARISAATAKPKTTVGKHGGDDAAGHAKHGADDAAGHAKHGADDAAGHAKHGAHDAAGHAKHGGDDAAGHAKHGGDDGPSHS